MTQTASRFPTVASQLQVANDPATSHIRRHKGEARRALAAAGVRGPGGLPHAQGSEGKGREVVKSEGNTGTTGTLRESLRRTEIRGSIFEGGSSEHQETLTHLFALVFVFGLAFPCYQRLESGLLRLERRESPSAPTSCSPPRGGVRAEHARGGRGSRGGLGGAARVPRRGEGPGGEREHRRARLPVRARAGQCRA